VTEGTAMAPWNGPNKYINYHITTETMQEQFTKSEVIVRVDALH